MLFKLFSTLSIFKAVHVVNVETDCKCFYVSLAIVGFYHNNSCFELMMLSEALENSMQIFVTEESESYADTVF